MTHQTKSMAARDAADKLLDYTAKIFTYDEMFNFQNKYKEIVQEYHKSPYIFLSTGIFLEKLDSFKNWLPELIANKDKIVPLLVSNMLKGDMFAESIYNEIYKQIGNNEVVTDIYKILNTPSLETKYSDYGRSGDAGAKINAEQWLISHEAADIFEVSLNGLNTLCYANQLLGVHNNYVDCDNI